MTPEITIIPLKVPCYLLKTGDRFMLIDTGDGSDCAALEKALEQARVTSENLKLVVLTHGDFDHAGNAAFLHQKYGVKIAIHAADSGMVERGDQGWNRKAKSDRTTLFGHIIIFVSSRVIKPLPFKTFVPDTYIIDGQDLSDYGFDAKILHLPGHSQGSIGVLTAEGDLFCGDLLMNMFNPAPHFLINDGATFDASIRKLKILDIRTVYPGHGKPFAMERFAARIAA